MNELNIINEPSMEITDEQLGQLQQAFDNLSEAVGTFMDSFIEAMKRVAEQLAPVIREISKTINDLLPELAEYMKHQKKLREVATPRQWHQYQNGRYRVRKKWEHAFEKRLQQQKRRK